MVSGRDPVLVNEPARGPARDLERIRKRKKSILNLIWEEPSLSNPTTCEGTCSIFRAPLDGKSRGECAIHLLGVDIQSCQNFKWMFLDF